MYMQFEDEELLSYNHAPRILHAFLTILCLMHVYWLSLFIKMLINAIKSGDTDDKQRSSVKKGKVISEVSELKKTNKID